jgi:hypothetical protein
MMHGREKSDSAIVAAKPMNKAGATAAEAVEPRAGTKRNAGGQSTHRTLGRARVGVQRKGRVNSSQRGVAGPLRSTGPLLDRSRQRLTSSAMRSRWDRRRASQRRESQNRPRYRSRVTRVAPRAI